MLAIIGAIAVVASILGGYWIEDGPLHVLFQPAEFLIIFGAAGGSFLIAASRFALRQVIRNLPVVFSGRVVSKDDYLDLLLLLNSLFTKMRREGLMSVEKDIERPESSSIFSRYDSVSRNPQVMYFIGDTMRVFLTTGDAKEIDTLMRIDMNSTLEQDMTSASNIAKVAESLPGLGIVAAVLGVVLTMGKITAPPEVLGHSIGAALVGTFLGVLGCYGFVGPMATKLENLAQEKQLYLGVVREAVAASIRGANPIIAVEYGRRAIPQDYRPTFLEMEERLRGA